MKALIFLTIFFTVQLFSNNNETNCFDIENLSNQQIQSCLLKNNEKLSNIYKELLSSYQTQGNFTLLLTDSQNAWHILRDTHCTLLAKKAKEEEINKMICGLQMTQARIRDLKDILPQKDNSPFLSIEPQSFRGISVSDPILEHKNYIQRNQLQTAEGTFLIYEIKDYNNNLVGYTFPDPNNMKLIGDIVVNTPLAQTEDGIHVGDTLKTLLEHFPNIKLHGSEIEGGTYAFHQTFAYHFDFESFDYYLDIRKIPLESKIIEIIIQREPQ